MLFRLFGEGNVFYLDVCNLIKVSRDRFQPSFKMCNYWGLKLKLHVWTSKWLSLAHLSDGFIKNCYLSNRHCTYVVLKSLVQIKQHKSKASDHIPKSLSIANPYNCTCTCWIQGHGTCQFHRTSWQTVF